MMANKSQNDNPSDKEFPPGMAPKLLKMLETIENLEETLDPLISKPHHKVLAKVRLKIYGFDSINDILSF